MTIYDYYANIRLDWEETCPGVHQVWTHEVHEMDMGSWHFGRIL